MSEQASVGNTGHKLNQKFLQKLENQPPFFMEMMKFPYPCPKTVAPRGARACWWGPRGGSRAAGRWAGEQDMPDG